MLYAQKDFSQKLGNSDNTIAESGALLVAFSNLLRRFGFSADPAKLDQGLRDHGIDSSKGMSWGFVSFFDPSIAVQQTGMGAPQFSDSIVRLEYDSKLTGKKAVTYAAVDSAELGTIVDSFDGIIKSWDVYGGPVEYVTFTQYPPIVLEPMRTPEAAHEPVPDSPDAYKVYTHLLGYGSSAEAIESLADNHSGIVEAGNYYIFNEMNGMLSLTKEPGTPGLWINPEKNVAADPVRDTNLPQPEDDESVRVPVRVIPPNPLKWQQTYVSGLGPIEYRSTEDIVVHDMTGEHPHKFLEKDTIVPVAGKFEKDGKVYYRTVKSVQEGNWYGVPEDAVVRGETIDDELDAMLNSSDEELREDASGRDKTIKAAATVEGKAKKLTQKLFSFGKK